MTGRELNEDRRRGQGADPTADWPALHHWAALALLCIATVARVGYSSANGLQHAFLDYLPRYHGYLGNDWYTAEGAPHAVFVRILGFVPLPMLEFVLAAIWIVTIVVLWYSYLRLGRGLGVSPIPLVVGGLVGVMSQFEGLGNTVLFNRGAYPTSVSYAFALYAMSETVRRDPNLNRVGLAAGLAILIHPSVGPWSLGLIVALGAAARLRAAALARVGLTALAVGSPSLAIAAAQQFGGERLTSTRQFELLAEIRHPHHMIFSSFPWTDIAEYAMWSVVLVVVGFVLSGFVRRVLFAAVGFGAGVIMMGAAASALGGPLVVVAAQPARIAPLIIALALVASTAAAAATMGTDRAVVAIEIVVLAMLGARAFVKVMQIVGVDGYAVDTGLISASGMTLLALAALRIHKRPVEKLDRHQVPQYFRVGLAIPILLAIVVGLTQAQSTRVYDDAWRSWSMIASQVRSSTPRDAVLLTPPDVPAMRFLGQREIVVDTNYRFGRGEGEWADRIEAVTGRELRSAEDLVSAQLASRYELVLEAGPSVACRYGATYVVSRHSDPEDWVTWVVSSGEFHLFRVDLTEC